MAEPAPGRRSGYRWVILGVGVLAQAAFSAVSQGLPSLGPALRDELGLSLSQTAVVFAAVGWGVMATLLVWGWVADRFGERIVLAAGLAGASLALGAAARADSYGGLIAGLACVGALGGATSIASGSAVIGWFDRHERGMALGLRQTALPLGGAAGALVLPVAVLHGGVDAALLLLAGATALGALVSALWVREPPAPATPAADRPSAPAPLRDWRVWRLSLGSALLICGQVAITSFVVLFLHEARGASAASAAAVLAIIQLGGAVTRLIAGRWSDVLGRRLPPLRHLALATGLAIAASGALATAPLALAVGMLVIAGLLAMSWNGLSYAATAELAGRRRAGTALGVQQTLMRALSSGTGIGFAAVVSASSWRVAFVVLATLPIGGWWVLRPLVAEEESRLAERAG